MEIKKMVIEDYQQVYQLWLSCQGMGLNNLDDSKEGIKQFLNRNPDTCFVACINKQIIGVIMAGHDGRRGYIYHTAVSPNFQNRGIGSKLVTCALDALKQAGINKVALVVFNHNESGNAFWQKQGFTTRDDITYRNKTLTKMIRHDT